MSIEDIIKIVQPIPRFVNKEDNDELMVEVAKDEILDVLYSFHKDKSFGPDGYTIEFFLGSFEILKEYLMKVVEGSRLDGRILEICKSRFISLIPKVDNPNTFDDFC